jgi:hypothetical protein
MLTLRMSDGALFRAKTDAGLVRQMKATQWNAPLKKGQYIEEVCERVHEMTGRLPLLPATTLTPTQFIDFLVEVGLVMRQ